VGVVDRAHVLEAIAGEPEVGAPLPPAVEAAPRPASPVRLEPVNDPSQETAEFLVENLAERSRGETSE
jgi:hypothetical protein